MDSIKVWNMDDHEWYAGRTREEVVKAYAEACELPVAEVEECFEEGYPKELSDQQMAKLVFLEDVYLEGSPRRSFREWLDRLIKEGCSFPRFFATTES